MQEYPHVLDRIDGDPHAADLSASARVVRVAAHLRREVEGDAEARLPLRQQVGVALVRLLRRAEAGVLAHRPEAPAVHVRLDAAREGRPTGYAEIADGVEVAGVEVVRAVKRGRVLVPGEVGDPLARRLLGFVRRVGRLRPLLPKLGILGHG